MLRMIWNRIYALDLRYALVISFAVIIVWGIMMGKISEKKEKFASVILLVFACLVILNLTLLRESGGRELRVFPLQGRFKAGEEYVRTLLMNVLLFVPFGMACPYILKGKYKVIRTAVIGLGISIAVEFLQYVFALGVSEADDLICNTAGAFFGSLGYYISAFQKFNRSNSL